MTKLKQVDHFRKFIATPWTWMSISQTIGIAASAYQYWNNKSQGEAKPLPQGQIELCKSMDVPEKKPALCRDVLPVETQLLTYDMLNLFRRLNEKALVYNLKNTLSHVLSE